MISKAGCRARGERELRTHLRPDRQGPPGMRRNILCRSCERLPPCSFEVFLIDGAKRPVRGAGERALLAISPSPDRKLIGAERELGIACCHLGGTRNARGRAQSLAFEPADGCAGPSQCGNTARYTFALLVGRPFACRGRNGSRYTPPVFSRARAAPVFLMRRLPAGLLCPGLAQRPASSIARSHPKAASACGLDPIASTVYCFFQR